jgi:soluble lytic murein transglycosylase-like protein
MGYAMSTGMPGFRQRVIAWLRAGWLRARRRWRRLPRLSRLPRWWRWALLPLVPILLINLAVAWVGRCAVFPLSPFFLGYKVRALGAYAWHRPRCALVGDEPLMPPLLARAERKHHLPCGLLGAIVEVESGGHAHRISPAGAMGPMQLIPPTARALGVSDPFDPEDSVDGAARYLHTQLETFHTVRLAAAAYNAGPAAIVGHRVPQNGQTEIYVDRVLRAFALERHARCVAARHPTTTPRPAVAKPVVAKPVVAKPVVAKPVVAKPVVDRRTNK